jgi:hypothetical protein
MKRAETRVTPASAHRELVLPNGGGQAVEIAHGTNLAARLLVVGCPEARNNPPGRDFALERELLNLRRHKDARGQLPDGYRFPSEKGGGAKCRENVGQHWFIGRHLVHHVATAASTDIIKKLKVIEDCCSLC